MYSLSEPELVVRHGGTVMCSADRQVRRAQGGGAVPGGERGEGDSEPSRVGVLSGNPAQPHIDETFTPLCIRNEPGEGHRDTIVRVEFTI
ncbi:MAG: hypothetical protein WB783_10065 [Arenicellales bacterium]